MERGFYKVYLDSNGFKTPVITYARSAYDAGVKALEYNRDDMPAATIHEVLGPYTTMTAFEAL